MSDKPATVPQAFDPAQFNQVIPFVAIKTHGKFVKEIMNAFANCVLKKGHIKAVQQDGTSFRFIILQNEKFPTIESVKDNLTKEQEAVIDQTESIFELRNVELDIQAFSLEDILKKLIPENIPLPSGFETIGHIAHLNLRDEQLPYRFIIGQAILLKNIGIKTVVTKIGNIETKFRTFNMEVIGGEDNLIAIASEAGVRYKLNFRSVYWNSKLSTEHEHLSSSFSASDIICDMMAGIGPFAIPAVKKVGCTVYANDLNPESFHYLNINRDLNKLPHDKLHTFNLDGSEFVRELVKNNIKFTHAIMNLPASAHTFLPVFRGLFPEHFKTIPEPVVTPPEKNPSDKKKTKPLVGYKPNSDWQKQPFNLPWIHCYGFSKAEDPKADFLKICETSIGHPLPNAQVRIVRDVSPKKLMMIASFPLPEEIAYVSQNDELGCKRNSPPDTEEAGSEAKKQKLT